ncbi:hypothetical protein BOVMAS36_16440 [Streptococcus uberis]
MTITKTKNGTYRLRVYIPEKVKSSLGIDKKVIEKRFKLRSEAKNYDFELNNRIENILSGKNSTIETNGTILFSDFYYDIWWESYKAGDRRHQQLDHLQKLLLIEQKLYLENTFYPC